MLTVVVIERFLVAISTNPALSIVVHPCGIHHIICVCLAELYRIMPQFVISLEGVI